MPKRQGHPFAIVAPVSAILVIVVLAMEAGKDRPAAMKHERETVTAEISVNHQSPATLSIAKSAGKAGGIVELTVDATETVAISIPAEWERREVRGAALSDVTSDPPGLGQKRWHLPDNVTLSLRADSVNGILVRNITDSPLLVIGKSVDVRTGKTEEKSVLVKKGNVKLW